MTDDLMLTVHKQPAIWEACPEYRRLVLRWERQLQNMSPETRALFDRIREIEDEAFFYGNGGRRDGAA